MNQAEVEALRQAFLQAMVRHHPRHHHLMVHQAWEASNVVPKVLQQELPTRHHPRSRPQAHPTDFSPLAWVGSEA